MTPTSLLKAKLIAVSLLRVIVSLLWAKIAMLITALAVSAYILRLPTLELEKL